MLRRILESYFQDAGKWDEQVVSALNGEEKVIARSLVMWLHGGSHSILDDLDYTLSGATVDQYLNVFARMFEESGHGRHYDMMMSDAAHKDA